MNYVDIIFIHWVWFHLSPVKRPLDYSVLPQGNIKWKIRIICTPEMWYDSAKACNETRGNLIPVFWGPPAQHSLLCNKESSACHCPPVAVLRNQSHKFEWCLDCPSHLHKGCCLASGPWNHLRSRKKGIILVMVLTLILWPVCWKTAKPATNTDAAAWRSTSATRSQD